MTRAIPIRVAILWHMHQPDYRLPGSQQLAMPWVRLHALKDYLDMPLTVARWEKARVTFNLVPSLLDQIELYVKGGSDRHLDLSRLDAQSLNASERLEILDTFFAGNPAQLIKPHRRFNQLHSKYLAGRNRRDRLPSLFSSSEVRDLQVWSNLTWVDPMFRDDDPIAGLFAKERHFSEEDKHQLLDWQIDLMRRIVPTYRQLADKGQIEVSFTPYYHPILPLLCNTEVAREALPSIQLPKKPFAHPEDARRQIEMAACKYEQIFSRALTAMWPSEGSVSEEVLQMMIDCGVRWSASDEEILSHSLAKSGIRPNSHMTHTVYEFGPGLRLLFRDHALSDRIGFVYSNWPPDRAALDFIAQIKKLRTDLQDQLDKVVVPVILDGENAWEYFPNDGQEFLNLLYERLSTDEEIRMVTFSEAVEEITPTSLPRIYAGSWINHNFRIWIGHEEDNAAWDLLSRARERLVQFERERPDFDAERLERAWRQIYVAEGSDWNWWYGDEHHSAHNEEFDRIFRQHLAAVYELLQVEVPADLLRPIHGGGVSSFTAYPEDSVTAQIDGRLTHFYEWSGAGFYDCLKAGGAMHRATRYITAIHFAYDHNRFYIRLDFKDKNAIDLIECPKIGVTLLTPTPRLIEVDIRSGGKAGEQTGHYEYALDALFELAIERQFLWSDGFGALGFSVTLSDGDRKLEIWPEQEPIQIDVPEKNKELFWPS